MTYREVLSSERLRRSLGNRAQLVDVPLSLRNSTGASTASFPRADWISSNSPSAVEKAAIDRDSYCCRMCGFFSKGFQRAVAMTGNRRDIDQMVTACIFCHQCLHLDLVAAMESGVLIWAPEVSQVELHHIAREIYVAQVTGGQIAETASACLAAIFARREVLKQQIGTDDPAALSVRIEMAGGQTSPDARLSSVRLFPLDRLVVRKGDRKFNLFPLILSYWVSSEGSYANVTSDSLSWLAYGRAVFVAEPQAPAQGQPTDQDGEESEKATNNDGKEFAFRRNRNDRFRFDILQLNTEKKEYEHIGEYQVIDVTESSKITLLKVQNLVHLLNGDNHLIHDFTNLTHERVEFELQESVDPTVNLSMVVFTTFDGDVVTKNAILTISKSIFWGE